MFRRLARPHLIALMLLLLPVLAAAAAPSLEDMVPADADMVLLVDDVPGLLQDWPNLPLSRAWNDPAFRDLLQGFAGDEEIPELPAWLESPGDDTAAETDPHARLVHALTGQIAIVVDIDRFSATDDDGENSHQMPAGVVILAQVDGNEDTITELLTVPEATEGAESEAGTEGAGGDAPLFALVEGTWKIANGVLVASASPEETAAQVALLAGERELLSLSSSEGFQAMRRHSVAGGIEMLFNLEVLVAKLTAELASNEEAFADNPLGVTPQAMLDGLGLDVFRAGWMSLRPAPEATDMTYGLTFSEERGVVRMLAFQPIPGDRRLPLPDSAVDATAFAYDMPGAWQAMTEIVTQVSPAMGVAMEAQIAQMSAQMGIDLVREIPGAFAGEFASATFLDEAFAASQGITLDEYENHLSQVWIATLREGHRMGEALDALAPMLGAAGITPTTRTVEGKILNVIAIPGMEADGEDAEGGGPVFAWWVGEEYLVTVKGSVDDLVMVMNGLQNGGRGIWGDPEVKALLNTLPEGASAVQYQDSSRLLSGLVSSLLMGAGAGAAGDGGEGTATPEQSRQLSDLVGRLITESAGAMYRNSGELVGQGRVLHGQP